jgi:WD40 repeat protein
MLSAIKWGDRQSFPWPSNWQMPPNGTGTRNSSARAEMRCVLRLKGHALLAKAAFGSDGRLIVSASMSANLLSDIAMWENGTLTQDVSKIPLTWEARQWSAETRQERLSFSVAAAATNQLGLSGDGEHVVSWTANGTVSVWSPHTGQQKSSFNIKPSHERIRALTGRILALSRDGRRLASTDLDRKVRLWDVTNGKQTFVLPDPPGRFLFASFDHDGRRLFSASDKTLKLWDAETGRELLALKSPTVIVGVTISPNGQRLASMGKDRTARLWDAVTGQLQLTLVHSTARLPLRAYVSALAFSPNGERLVSTSDDALLKLWNAETGEELLTFKGHGSVVRSVAFSPDGERLVSAADDDTVKVWDVATGQELLTFKLPHRAVSVAFRPDGQSVVSASVDGTVRVWDASNGQTTGNARIQEASLRTGEQPEN